MVSGTAVGLECCITEHQQAVQHSVCAEPSFRNESTGKDILCFLTYIGADNSDLMITLPSPRRYSPGWTLTSSTISLHFSLSFIFSIHCFIFITFRSATTSFIHLKLGLPFLLPTNSLHSITFLGIAPSSILFTCPSHHILWAFTNFAISSALIVHLEELTVMEVQHSTCISFPEHNFSIL